MWTNWSGGLQSRPRATDRPLDEAGVVAAVRRAAGRGQRIRPVGAPLVVEPGRGVRRRRARHVRVDGHRRVRRAAGYGCGRGRTCTTCWPNWPGTTCRSTSFPVATASPSAVRSAPGRTAAEPAFGSLSSLVRAVRLVDGRGELHRIDGPDLDAVRVGPRCARRADRGGPRRRPRADARRGRGVRPLAALLDDGFLEVHDWTELEVFPDGTALARWADPVEAEPVEERGVAGRAVAVGSAAAVGSAHALVVWSRAWRRLCGAPRAGGAARRSDPRTGCSSPNGRCGPR